MGCEAVIDRKAAGYKFWIDEHNQDEKEWRRLGKDIRDLIGRDVDTVFEHPGRQTFGASVFVAARGGKIVTCAATSGYMIEYDNRHLWMKLKRILSSHFANYKEAYAANQLIRDGQDPTAAEQGAPARARPARRLCRFTATRPRARSACCASHRARVSVSTIREKRERIGEDKITLFRHA